MVHAVSRRWREKDDGIWEFRSDPRHNTHSKLMSWLALDRGAQLGPRFGDTAVSQEWAAMAQKVRADICANGLDPSGKRFTTAYGVEQPDAALLLMPIHGFMEPENPFMTRTVEWVQQELAAGNNFLYRYRPDMDDGVGGAEGAFVLCGFWLAEALAMAGRVEQAQEVFVAHAESSNHLGLLAEEVHPTSRAALGNFPQAFSHLGLINAAARIDLALRLRDEGSGATPHLMGKLRP